MIRENLYLDTSVISVYFDPRDPFLQRQTLRFWDTLQRYNTYVSKLVELEISATSRQELRSKMLELMEGIPSLPVTVEAVSLARQYIEAAILPPRKFNDALHVALATTTSVDYLVSWNFHDLVRVRTRRMVNLVNLQEGYKPLEIVSPSEL